MEKLKIRQGAKVTVIVMHQDKEALHLRSTFEKNVNESSFLVSVPIVNGKRADIDQFQKLLIQYDFNSASYAVEGYIDDYVKVGVRNYWKIRKTSENRQFFQRADVRIKVQIPLKFIKKWWTPDGIDQQEELSGLTADISAGGCAMFGNVTLSVGEVVDLTLPQQGRKKPVDLRGEVCWVRDTEKGNAFRYLAGIKFIFMEQKEKERVGSYVAALEPQE